MLRNPKIGPLIPPPISYPILPMFSGMEDPLKVFHPQSKVSPKLLLVSPNLRAKFGFGAPQTHLKWDFRVKMGGNDSLPKSRKLQFLTPIGFNGGTNGGLWGLITLTAHQRKALNLACK